VELELSNVDIVLLILTLFVAGLTFGGRCTNMLQGVVHLPLFAIYVMLIFSP
jgi:Ca2+:H+ antiporter